MDPPGLRREQFAIKMAQALGVNLEPEVDTASPLTIYGGSVDATFHYVEAGFPIQPCMGLNMGGEAPVTMAGALVLTAATTMRWATLIQLIRPGAPMSVTPGLKPMDMRRGSPLFGAVAYSMCAIGANQLLRKYGIPACCAPGFTSTSKKTDAQDKAIEDILDEARQYYKEKGMISQEEWTLYMKTLEGIHP